MSTEDQIADHITVWNLFLIRINVAVLQLMYPCCCINVTALYLMY